MIQPSASRWEHWRRRLQQVRKAAPFASGVLAALAALLLYNSLFPAPQPLTTGEVNEAVAQAMASATPRAAFSATAYDAILPSVVLIQTLAPGTSATGGGQHGLGTGVVIDFNGDILTCLHVVAGATRIEVTFADGSKTTALVIAADPPNDIAVLQPIRLPDKVVPAVLGDSYSLEIGDEAYVVGNPFGLYGSMSAGVISGLERTFQPPGSREPLEGLIQVDAAVNPGNSGGPLVDREGRLIGIVVGIVNPTEDNFFIGIGFAVPIDVAGSAVGSPQY
ncbi:MAG TPA: trypsin-like peptidase domain-containing protein [Anaerolineales bacterium]